jgi:hypothetical protein
MILWEDRYASGDQDRDNKDFNFDQESRAELSAAQTIVMFIMDHNNVSIASIEPEDFGTGRWLAENDQLSWRDPGTATLEIPPDMKTIFRAAHD